MWHDEPKAAWCRSYLAGRLCSASLLVSHLKGFSFFIPVRRNQSILVVSEACVRNRNQSRIFATLLSSTSPSSRTPVPDRFHFCPRMVSTPPTPPPSGPPSAFWLARANTRLFTNNKRCPTYTSLIFTKKKCYHNFHTLPEVWLLPRLMYTYIIY